ncbi:hypothetical protein RCS94_06510 [Orbaceae bacterium ac157xtp]
MLNKIKLLYKLSPILLTIIVVFAIYFAYNCYQDEKNANNKIIELFGKLEQLEQKQIITNQVIAENATTKIELENKSIELQEQINELLKNNQCANELVPNSISNKLYNRAQDIRQSASSRKSVN